MSRRMAGGCPKTALSCLRGGLWVSGLILAPWAVAADVTAGPPIARGVTVYRQPATAASPLELDHLRGFALVTETRWVSLPAGESRLRFPGVADGLQPESALLAGLPGVVLEKNRDARLLTPVALMQATVGRRVTLVRTDKRTGRTTRVPGTVRAAEEGIVFESSEGTEGLYCSGFPETFELSEMGELEPVPVLSVKVRSPQPVSARVTLSYLTTGFDWRASYTGRLSRDGRTLTLGGWVTLANSNGESFPDSRVAVVAGKVGRAYEEAAGKEEETVLAQCWPMGTTGHPTWDFRVPEPSNGASKALRRAYKMRRMEDERSEIDEIVVVTGSHLSRAVQAEQLGDLKLYRVPESTTVNARQQKQVRLLDRGGIPVNPIYFREIEADSEDPVPVAAQWLLRTRNDRAHHLGLALPMGRLVLANYQGLPTLQQEVRDLAVNEKWEIEAGASADVQVQVVEERDTLDEKQIARLPLLPGVVHLRKAVMDAVHRIEITNARRTPLTFEARLVVAEDSQLIWATRSPFVEGGHTVLRIGVPAHGKAVIRYLTEHNYAHLERGD